MSSNIMITNDENNVISVKRLLSVSIKNDENYEYINTILQKTVKDCDFLYFQICDFIKLFLLFDYENNTNNFKNYDFNRTIVKYCFNLIINNGIVNKRKTKMLIEHEESNIIEQSNDDILKLKLLTFYNYYNSNVDNVPFKCPDNLASISHIIDDLVIDICKNITNNIIINYFKYVKEYVTLNLKIKHKNIIENNNLNTTITSSNIDTIDTKQTIETNNLNVNLNDSKINTLESKHILSVYNDIINNTKYSDVKFHLWIDEHKVKIIPTFSDKETNKNILTFEEGKTLYEVRFNKFIKDYLNNNETLKLLIKHNKSMKKSIILSITIDLFCIDKNNYVTNIVYHDWIIENSKIIINEFNKSNRIVLTDKLESTPFLFLNNMLFMNKFLESKQSNKHFQIIPLRTNMTPKFIPICKNSFIDIIDVKYMSSTKTDYHKNSEKVFELYTKFFNFDFNYDKNLIKKEYVFSGLILTNGYEIIFNYQSKSYYDKKEEKLKHMFSFRNCNKQLNIENNKPIDDKDKEIKIQPIIDNNYLVNEYNGIEHKILELQQKTNNINNITFKNYVEHIDNITKMFETSYKNIITKVTNDIKTSNLLLESLHKQIKQELKENMEKEILIILETTLKTLYDECDEIIKYYLYDDIENKIHAKQNKKLLEYVENYKSSNESYIKYCYSKLQHLIVDGYNSLILKQYEFYLKNLTDVDTEILDVKKSIKNLTKELKLFNKKTKQNHDSIIVNEECIIYDNKTLIKNTSLINKIREKTKLLEFETENKEETMHHIKQIKNTIISSILNIKNVLPLNVFLNELIKNNNDNFKNIFMNNNTQNCIELSNKIIKLVYETFKIKINKLHKKHITFKDYTIEEKNNHKLIVNKITLLNTELNLLLLKKNKIDNTFKKLFKNKNGYIKVDNMNEDYLQVLNKLNWVVIDPGMNSLFTMLSKPNKDGKQKKFNYTKQKHLSRTKRKEMLKKINKIKSEKITILENSLIKEDKRLRSSNDYKTFNLYHIAKCKIYDDIKKLYNDKRLNKLRWYSYLNEKRSENMMVNDIKNKFGKDVVLILGDWSMNKGCIKGHSPTPNVKYTRILEREFITLKIDEFRTSIIHNKLERKCINLKKLYNKKNSNIKSIYNLEKIEDETRRKNKKEKIRQIHKILVCNSNVKLNEEKNNINNYPKGTLFVNRDNNSVKNMIKIVESYINTGLKPKCFVRGTKICMDTLKVF